MSLKKVLQYGNKSSWNSFQKLLDFFMNRKISDYHLPFGMIVRYSDAGAA